jgi:uncharacterized protein
MTNKQLMRFLVVTFGLAFLLQAYAIHQGVLGAGRFWLGMTMWAPLVGALSTSRESRRLALGKLRRGGLRFFPVALLVGSAFIAGQQILLALIGAGRWNSEAFPLAADGNGIAGVKGLGMMLGVSEQGFAFFAVNFVLTVAVASVIGMLKGGIGEEAGWRGVLQPELERRLGSIKGTVCVGVIWGYWHVPANLFGYNDQKHPVLTALVLFPAFTVALAFALAWIAKRSGSVWPAGFAHAANNTLNAGLLVVSGNWLLEQGAQLAVIVVVGGFFAWRLGAGRTQREPAEDAAVPA